MANEITVVVHGSKELEDALKLSVVASNAASRRIVERGALLMISEAKRTFRPRPGGQRTSAKTGKTYYSFVPPYEAIPPKPTSRSGALQTSLGKVFRVSPVGATGWMARFGTDLSYAAAVEYGTRFMQPEPYLGHGVESAKAKVQALAEAEWMKAVKA